jgi:peptide/nickel transport system permease protein
MAAALFVDGVFAYGGLGTAMLDAMHRLDVPLLMAVVFITSMIVMAAAALTSLCLRLLGGGKLGDALSDWVGRGPAVTARAPAAAPTQQAPGTWTRSAWLSFRSNATGMSALIVLCAIIALGALAPVIAPAPEPSDLEYLEPNIYPDWWNPLQPSLEPSPYTGMTHLLGTDYIGRDVLSIWLFGALDAGVTAAALIAGTLLMGLVVGIIAAETHNVPDHVSRVPDFILTAAGRAIVAIPLPLFVAARFMFNESLGPAPFVIMLAFYAWAWMLVARPVRAAIRAAGTGVGKARKRQFIVAESLSVAKFAVPLIMLIDLPLYAMGLGTGADLTWGMLLDIGYSFSAQMTGDWHLILPPLAGIVAVGAAVFVMLDRAETAVRSVE